MTLRHLRRRTGLAALAVSALALTACGDAPTPASGDDAASGSDAASATSVEDFGGFDELVAAAQEEGTLNVIALPPDWTNYGYVISTFSEKYDI
ncbi:hypothetical protein BH24ACT10_BH24ACT10_14300 [soil metagenome]